MSLDVRAAARIDIRAKLTRKEIREIEDWLTAKVIQISGPFLGRPSHFPRGGYYRVGTLLHFSAGSYLAHWRWRNMLASLLGHPLDDIQSEGNKKHLRSLPFYELLTFGISGTMGPMLSAKLAKDFSQWAARAKTFSKTLGDDEDWWLADYKSWHKLFSLAAKKGAVTFS